MPPPPTNKLEKWKRDRDKWANGHGGSSQYPGPHGEAPKGPDTWANQWGDAVEQWGEHVKYYLELYRAKINELANQHGGVSALPDPEVPPPPRPPFD